MADLIHLFKVTSKNVIAFIEHQMSLIKSTCNESYSRSLYLTHAIIVNKRLQWIFHAIYLEKNWLQMSCVCVCVHNVRY